MEPANLTLISIGLAVLGLLWAVVLTFKVKSQPRGDEKMVELSDEVYRGAMTFLNKEYKGLIVFALVVTALLGILGWKIKDFPQYIWLAYIVGAFLSALAGNLGMRIATIANSRAANAVDHDIKSGLKVAFASGGVMGLSVVGFGVLGIGLFYYFGFKPEVLFGFGFGASSIALFARVGGGIYTKAADVGADLVGKVEAGIPEDSPRNPAVIADNVGDNVGDVAGMGADLFESYANSIISAMALSFLVVAGTSGELELLPAGFEGIAMVLPLLLAGIGIFSSLVGSFFVGRGSGDNLHMSLNLGVFASAVIMAVLSFGTIYWLFEGNLSATLSIFGAMIAGLIVGVVIGLSTEIYTSYDYSPTQSISEASETGAATNIIRGISVGMKSTWVPVLAVVVGIICAHRLAGLYGIALSAVGMLSTLGITLAVDCFGPVADNAAGIAEMAGMGQDVREKAEALDSVGNTTAAIGKGFAIGSAALTALALFSNYQEGIGDISFSITNPRVMVGLLIGGLLPFLFSAVTMLSVGQAAQDMITEVRRQFDNIPEILDGDEKPDYQKCIDISTTAALREMILPGTMAVVIPILVGIWDPSALGGLLAGAIVTGFLLAIFMANSGGAWDNAKKFIEKGNFGGKGSDAHSAAVVGDTVGDPFKDTSGPSLNILIKLMSIVSVVFVPLFLEVANWF
ncbi:MAG: sodium-translocating pyrophosphatase [bacterium]